MLTKWSGIGMVEGSGKLGGTVMYKGRSGAVARVGTKIINPQSPSQITRRANLSARSQAWQGLTASQRSAWNAAAASGQFPQVNRLGVTYNPTGFQLYVKLNYNIVFSGASAISDPPAPSSLSNFSLTFMFAILAANLISVQYTGTMNPDERVLLYCTPGLSAGVARPSASQFRFISSYGPAPFLLIYDPFKALFGKPKSGQRIFVKADLLDSKVGLTKNAGMVTMVFS